MATKASPKSPAPKAAPCPGRCGWCGDDPLYVAYHDSEWGVPCRDERKMFEFMVLESAQSGLSWITILRKREGYRKAFDGFDPAKIAAYGEKDFARLMADASIVRNRSKIAAAIGNAKALLALHAQGRSLTEIAWSHVGGSTLSNRPSSPADIPAKTAASEAFAKELKGLGFAHFGPVVAYSHMQALGLVDDHLASCPFGAGGALPSP